MNFTQKMKLYICNIINEIGKRLILIEEQERTSIQDLRQNAIKTDVKECEIFLRIKSK